MSTTIRWRQEAEIRKIYNITFNLLKLTVLTHKVPNKHVPLEKTVRFEPMQEELLQGRHQTSFTT